jgi:Flp pilus assembly pilin Flp
MGAGGGVTTFVTDICGVAGTLEYGCLTAVFVSAALLMFVSRVANALDESAKAIEKSDRVLRITNS